MQQLLLLDDPEKWPEPLTCYLDAHHDLFLKWERKDRGVDPKAYDGAIYGLIDVLQPYAIRGWHCTRLTDNEIAEIVRNGMQLPDADMLHRRIDALVACDLVDEKVSLRLKTENQASDASRAGMIWFCFFPPHIAGEIGIGRFFRHWGGEALYNSHERDPTTSPAIGRIGTPCVVEAEVPISALGKHGGLSFKVVRRFLIGRGYQTSEPVDHEDRAKRALGPECICRVVRYPEPEFLALTGCGSWRSPITAGLGSNVN